MKYPALKPDFRNLKFPARILTFISAVILFFNSCVKEEMDMSKTATQYWNPDLAVPLIYSSLTIEDILRESDKNGNIIIGSDKFCTLIYEGRLFSLKAVDFISLPNQAYNHSVGFNAGQAGSFNGPGSVTIASTYTVNYNPGAGIEIDSVKFKSGSLNITINATFPHSGLITLTIPNAKRSNGSQFSYNLSYSNPGLPRTYNLDLSGFNFDMTKAGAPYNRFDVNFSLQLTKTGGTVTTADQVSLDMNFTNQKFDRLFGYVGQQSLSPNKDTVLLSIFNNSLGSGTFTLVDPRVHVYISNSYGVPISASFSQFDSWNPKATPQIIPFSGPGIPNPLNIPTPTLAQFGQTKIDSFKLDTTNSNIRTIINNTPKNVIYQINSLSNPAGKVGRNFVLDTSHFEVDMKIELPMWGTAKNFSMQDTLTFDFDDIQDLESILFRVYSSNGYPIDMDMQVYFVDSLYKKLDSLISPFQRIIPSGVVDPVTYKVVSSTVKTTDSFFDRKRLDKIIKSKKIIVKGTAHTTNNGTQNVKIYSYYKLDVKLGVRAKLKMKLG